MFEQMDTIKLTIRIQQELDDRLEDIIYLSRKKRCKADKFTKNSLISKYIKEGLEREGK